MTEQGRTWKVGELARLTGLTVRTLHHYEHVGLVRASGRTAAGHRLYGEADLRRLYRVLALRDLGLSLEAIGGLLDGGPDLEGLLGGQLAQVERRIDALTALRGRLAAVLAAARAGGLSSDHLLGIIEGMSDVQGSMESYFTPEQLAELERRREEGGERAAEQAAAWPGLIAEVEAAMASGTDPASPRPGSWPGAGPPCLRSSTAATGRCATRCSACTGRTARRSRASTAAPPRR
ncbi:MerR family transcriptional regulator [Nocardiopsis composta]